MTTDRSLTSGDIAVALRSFPRRFRAVFEAAGDDGERLDPDEIGRRVGPDGTSAADHLVDADGILVLLDDALVQAARGGDPALHPSFADLGAATWDDAHTPVPALLDQFEATATRTADRVDDVSAQSWGNEVRIADHGTSPTLLTIAQDAIGVVAGHLRAAQKVVDAVV